MSGLPRSGSHLLVNILNQSPNIYASTNSPLLDTLYYTKQYFNESEQVKSSEFFTQNSHNVLKNIPNNFYHNITKPIIVDKSRGWVNQVEIIQQYITESPKIICPVRNVLNILTSFIHLIETSSTVSFIDKSLMNLNVSLTNDNRCDYLMSPNGIIGNSLYALSESYRKGFGKYLLLIEYESLVSSSQKELNRIHQFFDIPEYDYEFSNIPIIMKENDNVYGLQGMHEIRNNIKAVPKNPRDYLSSYVIEKYSGLEFWRTEKSYSVFGL